MLRRLVDGPVPMAELLAIDGASVEAVCSLLDGLPPLRPRLVVEFDGAKTHSMI
jgi:hypothetical protein